MRSIVARRALLQSLHPLQTRPTVQAMQRTLAKKKDTSKGYKHTHSYLQILGNGTDTGETMPSVLLFFDAYRYVFNVGEGFQRYCFQHRLKLGKLHDVFLTRMSTEAAGGVPGLFITLSENGIHGTGNGSVFNLHGPVKLDTFLKALKTFVSVPMEGMGWTNFGSEATAGEMGAPLISNQQVEIRPVLLLPEEAQPKSPSPFLTTPDWRSVVPVACYVCQLAESRGKFLPVKAKALGVKEGPDFAKLVAGMCVEASNGNIIHPEQVMEPTLPGPTVLIMDCPDRHYTEALFAAPAFEPYYRGGSHEGDVVVVHLGPFEVVSADDYQSWMHRFSDAVEHIFVNERATNATAIMRQATVVQSKLNLVDPHYFPMPQTISSQEDWQQEGAVMGKDLLKYHLKPISKKGVDNSQLLEAYSHTDIVETLKEDEALFRGIQSFHARRDKAERTSKIAANELEITFLGTGSAIPSKYRNVTGIYLDFFERGSMMLDCGEGSYGQLIRRFGRAAAEEALEKLQCIWISHIHADHHIGLPTILRQRRKRMGASAPPLLIMGPPALYATMQSYEQLEPLSFQYLFTHETNEALPKAKHPRLPDKSALEMFRAAQSALNLASIDSFLVDHCAHAYGVALVSQSGWKVVFSGDTVPCASVLEHSKDATLLIHEATFEEEMKAEALYKKHSTVRDAVKIATEANAYRTILTHFSQRYPKIPVIEADASAGICIAFDLMSVNLSDLEMLPYTLEPCQGLFQEEQTEPEEPALACA